MLGCLLLLLVGNNTAVGIVLFMHQAIGVELRKFSEKKKKRVLSGLQPSSFLWRTSATTTSSLRHHCRILFKPLLYYTAISSFSSLLALTIPTPNPSQVLAIALALTTTRAPRHRCRISFNIQRILAFPVS